MSNHAATQRAWSKQELHELREDWRRTNHNLTQVAELHACDRYEIVTALGLTEADIKRPKKARRELPRWETLNPEKAAEFVRLLEAGSKMTAACAAVGIEKTNTGYTIYKRIKERKAIMENEKKLAKTTAPVQQVTEYCDEGPSTADRIAADTEAMGRLLNDLTCLKLLNEKEIAACDIVLRMADCLYAIYKRQEDAANGD